MDIIKAEEYNNIYACDLFSRERAKLYQKNPNDEKSYANWLSRQLGYLDTTGLTVLKDHSQAFEKLGGVENNIYSITRRKFRGNPRILFFTIIEDGEADIFVLLTAFKELSSGDYKRYIPIAIERMKQILLKIEEEK